MWEALFKRYWQVALLKESPENTPYSLLLLMIASFLFFSLIILQWQFADLKQAFNIATSILAAISLLLSYFVFTYLLLKINRKANRVLQTLTSLLICHSIIHFFAFPLLIATPMFSNGGINQALLLLISIVYLILTLVLTGWQFLVTIHIYRRALESDNLTAVLASFGLLACNILTVSFWQ